jgi:RNA polymerase sigma factor FliA
MQNVKEKNGRLSAQETLALWQAYKESGDPRLRDRLVLTFAPMVKYIVYRKVREIPARCEVEDFISCGLEALIRSIDRYDPAKGATLEQFSWTRIHGAVLDELRRNDWAPRSLRRWDRDINKSREQFIGLYGRPPTNVELSDSLGIATNELVRRQDEITRSTRSCCLTTTQRSSASTRCRARTASQTPCTRPCATTPRRASGPRSSASRRAIARSPCCSTSTT